MAGATWNCRRLGARSVCTRQPCTSLRCHFWQSHICRVHVSLAVTSYLHFWHNDRDLLRATQATRGWNGYWNESERMRLILQGLEPARPFDHEPCALTSEPPPLPIYKQAYGKWSEKQQPQNRNKYSMFNAHSAMSVLTRRIKEAKFRQAPPVIFARIIITSPPALTADMSKLARRERVPA